MLHTFPGHQHRERAGDVALFSRFGSGLLYSEVRMGDVLSLFTIRVRALFDNDSHSLLGAPHLFTPAVTSDRVNHMKVPVFSFPTFTVIHHGSAAYSPICVHLQCFLSTTDNMETA